MPDYIPSLEPSIMRQPQRMAQPQGPSWLDWARDMASQAAAAAPDRQFYGDVARTVGGGLMNPDFYSGLAKEASVGLIGLPGDLGYMAGGMIPAAVHNWNEGLPLDTNMGDPRDYLLTSDGVAADLGIPFSGSGAENAGRAIGGAIDIGAIPSILNRLGKAFPDTPQGQARRPGAPGSKQRGGPFIEGSTNSNILKYYPERSGEPVEIIRNPVGGDLREAMMNAQDSTKFPPKMRWVEDPATGDIYGGDATLVLHEDIAKAAGFTSADLFEGRLARGESEGGDFRWLSGKGEFNYSRSMTIDKAVGGRRQEWPEKPDNVEVVDPEWSDKYDAQGPFDPGLINNAGPIGRQRGAVSLGLINPNAPAAPGAGMLKHDPVFPDQPTSDPAANIAAGVEPGQIISTRYPTAVGRTQDPDTELLKSGVEAVLADPKQAKAQADIFKAQPGTRIPADASPEKAIRMQMDFEAENMVDLYNSLDPMTRERAKLWYQGANRRANAMAAQYGKRIENAAGVYASLSPSKDWYQNVEIGDRLMKIMGTKQNAPWSEDMAEKARWLTRVEKGKQKNPGMKKRLANVSGKRLADLTDPKDKADWVRIYDEAYHNLVYPRFTPEGEAMGLATRKDGKPQTLVWQSNDNMASAIRAFEAEGDVGDMMRVISPEMGTAHKVRNFYNNIVDPLNPSGDATIDTHQVAAGLMRPLGGSSAQVKQNFDGGLITSHDAYGPATRGPGGNSLTGVSGTYNVRQGATQQAGEMLGIPAAQVQSPSWEQIRTVFPTEIKNNPKLNADIERIWNEYGNRQLSRSEAFEHIMNLRPLGAPDWATARNGVLAAMFGGSMGLMGEEQAAVPGT